MELGRNQIGTWKIISGVGWREDKMCKEATVTIAHSLAQQQTVHT